MTDGPDKAGRGPSIPAS